MIYKKMFILDTKLICKYSTEYFEGVIIMGAYATVNQSEYIRNMKKNQEDVRDMVLDSYQDMQDGKGRDYKEFFSELESRYHISDV